MNKIEESTTETTIDYMISELYSRPPKDIGEVNILPVPEKQEDLDDGFLIFIFEMLLDFYVEGLCHHEKLQLILDKKAVNHYELIKDLIDNKQYDDIDFKTINENSLHLNDKWIESIGFYLRIDEEEYSNFIDTVKDEDLKKDYYMSNYYCKILLKSNPQDEAYFEYKNLEIPYHFIKNSDFDKTKVNDIKDIYALLIKNKDNKVYRISFRSIKL